MAALLSLLAVATGASSPQEREAARALTRAAARLDDPEQRLGAAMRAVAAWESLPRDHPGLARALQLASRSALRLDDTEQAAGLMERAVSLAPSPGRLFSLGWMRSQLDQVVEAEMAYRRIEGFDVPFIAAWAAKTDAAQRHAVLARSLVARSFLARDRGDFVDARNLALRAVELAEGGRPAHELEAHLALGEAANLVGDIDVAAESFGAALALNAGSAADRAAVSLDLAELHRSFGDPRRAERGYRTAIRLLQRSLERDPSREDYRADLAWGRTQLAVVLTAREHWDEAAEVLDQAIADRLAVLPADHPDLAWSFEARAELRLRTGQPESALADAERAFSLRAVAYGREHRDTASALALRGRARADGGDTGAAIVDVLEAERARQQMVRIAIQGMPERQALRYLGTTPRWADFALAWLAREAAGLAHAGLAELFDTQIRGRGLVLDEVTTRHRQQRVAADPVLSQDWQRVVAARTGLAKVAVSGGDDLDTRLRRARAEKEAAEAALFSRLDAPVVSADIGLEQVRAALPDSARLVAYVRSLTGGSERYFAFVLSGTALELVDLGDAATIDALVSRWRDLAGAPAGRSGTGRSLRLRRDVAATALQAYLEAAEGLRQRIFDPLGLPEEDAGLLFVVPDGALSFVSFAGLPDGDRFLVERGWKFHYLTTERDLAREPPANSTSPRWVAVGDPSFAPAGGSEPGMRRSTDSACVPAIAASVFEPLPGSAIEVERLAAIWEGALGVPVLRSPAVDGACRVAASTSGVLSGACASEANFRSVLPGASVVHLATHGFFVDRTCEGGRVSSFRQPGARALENPLLLSGLALAAGNDATNGQDDGILTAEEIASFDLSATGWAVLSACETGLGAAESGEGVFGMRRALLLAGARTVIMSLWSVPDLEASDWMIELYSARLLRQRSTVDAVHEATLTLLARLRETGASVHPQGWALFVAAGDWR